MKILQVSPPASPLVRDWLAGREPAASLYPGAPGHSGRWGEVAQAVDDRFTRAGRERAASLLRGGGQEGPGRLERFVEEGGFMVTTGQQPVLLGGPLYVLYKALTAVALASRMEEVLGRPVLPVFWVGADDHDWDEARRSWLLDTENEEVELELPARPGPSPALYRIPLAQGAELSQVLERLLRSLPDSDFAPPWKKLLEAAWGPPQVTLSSGFSAQLQALTQDAGLFVAHSHDPALRSAARPLLEAELEGAAEAEAELQARSRVLEEAGYPVQVAIAPGATNLFLDGPRSRDRILRGEGSGFTLRGYEGRLSRRDLEGGEGTALTPNVLLRPVVEAYLFPTLAYVAGPGEAAYQAQIEPLFRRHGVVRPLVHPRLSAVVMERKVEKVLQKHTLELEQLATPFHELAGRLAREELPEGIRRELGQFRGAVARHTTELAREVAGLDPTLRDSVEQLRSNGFTGLAEVEKKVVQALKRENEITLAQIAKAQLHLFPGGIPQERRMNPWYFLFRYGPAFLEQVLEQARSSVEALQARTSSG